MIRGVETTVAVLKVTGVWDGSTGAAVNPIEIVEGVEKIVFRIEETRP